MKTLIAQRKVVLTLATLAIIFGTSFVFQITQNFYTAFTVGEKYYQSGQYSKALPYFIEAHNREPKNVRATGYLLWTYQGLGLKEEANELLRKILQDDPDNVKVVEQLADGLHGISDYPGAEMLYKLVLKHEETQSVKRKLVGVLASQKKYPQAIAIMVELVAERPRDLELKEYLADLYSWDGKYSEAIDLYKEAYESDPKNNPHLLKKTADVLRWAKRNDEAVVIYRQYLQEE
jgi:tetratricopeptide (TPR) repeat protein